MKAFRLKPKKQEQSNPQADTPIKKITIVVIFLLFLLLLNGLFLLVTWNRYVNIAPDAAIQLAESQDISDNYFTWLFPLIPKIIIATYILMFCLGFICIRMQNSTLRTLDKKLSLNKTLYRKIFYQASIGIAIIKQTYFVPQSELGDTNINPMFKKILGRTGQDLETVKWSDISHPDDLDTDNEYFEQLKKGEIGSYSMKKRFIRPDGSSVWTNMRITSLKGLPYKEPMYLCLIEDLTLPMATSAALNESERSKSVFLSHLPGLAYRCNYDSEWTMQYVSPGCFELTGYPAESLLHNRDRSFNSVIAPEYCDILSKEWDRVVEKRLPFKFEYEIITATNERKWVLEMGQALYDHKGNVQALEGIILDISDRKKIEDDLRYINEHDSLTGLYNRRVLERLLIDHRKQLSKSREAVININLSTVQSMTKTYGFAYTQELIKEAADVLRQFCSDHHLLFITYLDNFVFYITEYGNREELLLFCESISNSLSQLLRTERISGGIGIVEIDSHKDLDIDVLLKKLLIASEKSMNHPGEDFFPYFYGADIEADILRQDDIKAELRHIIDDDNDGGLFLQYQPILDLKSNRICGFEALTRLNSNKLGLIPPLEFIPLAEETKLIIPIGQKIIRQALSFLKKLSYNGHKSLWVSINVSVIQLLRNNFVENLFEIIDEMDVNPANVGIELTESIFSDEYEEVNRIIDKLRNAGIFIAIDDFGTGYSSLARERELNVDCLKIDKFFVDKLIEIHPDQAITRDIISMAHKLGHFAIAEGVEDEEQLQSLKKWNCDRIQGYLISKPLDEDRAIELLSNEYNMEWK